MAAKNDDELSELPPTISVAHAAKLLGVSRSAAYRAAASGQLPTITFGRRLLVPTISAARDARSPGRGGELMRGSIRRRGNTYTWYISVPDPVTGERRQRSRGGFRTKRECQEALNEALARCAKVPSSGRRRADSAPFW